MQKITKLKWLKRPAVGGLGITFSIPWKRGELKEIRKFVLVDERENIVRIDSWPMAYWDDGSIKWMANSGVIPENFGEMIWLCEVENELLQNESEIEIVEEEEQISINNNVLNCVIKKQGEKVIEHIFYKDKLICSGVKSLLLMTFESSVYGINSQFTEQCQSEIAGAKVEQRNSERCVIKVWGRYLKNTSMKFEGTFLKQGWIPFEIRLYFYKNSEKIKVVHTFLYDTNPYQYFIKGLGVEITVPLSSPLFNRYVRFAGDTGLFCESPVNFIDTGRTKVLKDLILNQINGKPISSEILENEPVIKEQMLKTPLWDEYYIYQDSSEHYSIKKRTSKFNCYVTAVEGRRSKGFAYVGDQNGGIGVALKDFWEKYPSSFQVLDLTQKDAKLITWFWPLFNDAMDLRHYDFKTYTGPLYEGFDEFRATPYGIGNTNEIWLYLFDKPAETNELSKYAQMRGESPLLVCEPERYYSTEVFAGLSLPNLKDEISERVEKTLKALIDFYLEEIDRRKWYGFWNYGDFMHSYETLRHNWRYDSGGYAWQNTELVPNIWLWLMFLRTGEYRYFKIAEAMTRHTSEVDIYHIGEYKGLGSRHNVVHWGCGCKEVRISMAYLHRYYYYLTADERIGEIMDMVKDIDLNISRLDPMRTYFSSDDESNVHIRIGPDIMTFCSNWFVRWERYHEENYKQKIMKVLEFLKENPAAFISGTVVDYLPDKLEMRVIEYTGGSNFAFCFGNYLVWIEIAKNFNDEKFEDLCAKQGLFYSDYFKDKERILNEWKVPLSGFNTNIFNFGMVAFAAYKYNLPELKEAAFKKLLEFIEKLDLSAVETNSLTESYSYPVPYKEIPQISTNIASQWSINAIFIMGLF